VIEAHEAIQVVGAREHNLKNISLNIPRGRLVVITGVSGSGKSTLAFDLLFAEGQRRFLDSMNAYARQFVEQLARPDVDLIAGIPPTVSIEQRLAQGGGKSTVATVTEVHHFLRLLYARLGVPYCPQCQVAVQPQTRDQVCRRLLDEARGQGPLTLLAPLIRNRKGFHTEVAGWAARHGYEEIRADGRLVPSSNRLRLDRFREHNLEVVTGRVLAGPKARVEGAGATPPTTVRGLVDETLDLGHGVLLSLDAKGRESTHSTERGCPSCGTSMPPLDPKIFSYNSPQGWCPRCRGFGELFYLPEVERGARADAIEESWFGWMEGKREPCPECGGARLNPIARAVRLPWRSLADNVLETHPTLEDLNAATVQAAAEWFAKVRLEGRDAAIARDILPEIAERLKFLREVGLGYLQLGRAVTTLSGGEAQRIRLAAQLGSNLAGVLYVLDEPTIGLHARDNEMLLDCLESLRERGNSLVVVEHDEATMRRADHIIDLGPGAGVQGGHLVAAGRLADILKHPDSLTGQWLRSRHPYPTRGQRRAVPRRARGVDGKEPAEPTHLVLTHANRHNLKDLTVAIPLGRFVAVTGVSGSGKSTLVRDCLLPALAEALAGKKTAGGSPSEPRLSSGGAALRGVYEVDQSPIGRTPRSIPATYVGFFDHIRALFAQTPEARLRGYGAGRFSFNSPAGRCAECQGSGTIKLEMSFLPPAYVTCEACGGRRFTPETLDVLWSGRNIAQVLDLSVAEARDFFAAIPRVRRALEALHDTGLDYLKLGQISPTLSGGEAQRVKLVTHLLGGLTEGACASRAGLKRSLFVLEEPTIGLHASDVRRLVEVLQRLVDAGHTVLVIEHHLELIAEADWVIDLGPEGGEAGGRLVAEGPPEAIAKQPRSHTGRFLADLLNPS
jgi:excinuclease ABC subunit A